MRLRIVVYLFIWLFIGRAFSAALPLTVKEISLMLRTGYSNEAVLKELSARHFADTISASNEAMLQQAGANADLIGDLKSGAFSLSPEQTTAAQKQISDVEKRQAAEGLRLRLDTLSRGQAAPSHPEVIYTLGATTNPPPRTILMPASDFRLPPPVVYEKLNSSFNSEQHWIADQIFRDIAEMMLFAKEPATAPNKLKLEVTNNPRGAIAFHASATTDSGQADLDVQLQHHLWSTKNYTPWATLLIKKWQIRTPNSHPTEIQLTDSLTATDFATLIRESQRVSDELNRDPLNPVLHEEAAFILGCFALREASGLFSDTRFILSRMTAHLAIARALQPNESETGRLARITQLCLIERQTEAMDEIKNLPAADGHWANVLRLRATGDWRLLKSPENATEIEELEYFRALRQSNMSQKSCNFVKQVHPKPLADWDRIAMEGELSVEEGNVFAATSLILELKELSTNWQTVWGKSLQKTELIEALNEPATRCVVATDEGKTQMQVLSWGDLAAFHQRHICHSLMITHNFMRDHLGAKNSAAQFERSINDMFSKLVLFPVVKRQISENRKFAANASTLLDGFALWRDHPELLTPATYWGMFGNGIAMDIPSQPQPASRTDWFQPEIPFGTAYHFVSRFSPGLNKNGFPFLNGLTALAPFDLGVQRNIAWAKFGKSYTAEQLAEAEKLTLDFSIRALHEVAMRAKDNPELREKILWQMCALEPFYFIDLGDFYLDRQIFAKAAAAFQSAFDQADDRVSVANNCRWLVGYYLEAGRKDEAEKIARDAAEAYSARGLATMAFFLEKTGKIKDAEDYLKKLVNRYPRSDYETDELKEFYIRNRKYDPDYEKLAQAEITKLFRGGLEQVTLASFTTPPSDGAKITSETTRVKNANLKVGDIIVAVDGLRIHRQGQYFCIRDTSFDPNMALIVWDGTQYVERRVNLPDRRLNCEMSDFYSSSTVARR